jgi:hypothetical protein
MELSRHTIRNIDRELITDARILALQCELTLGDIVNRGLELAIAEAEEADNDE